MSVLGRRTQSIRAVTRDWDEQSLYPLIDDIPWLLPSPQNSLLDWSIKLNHFQQVLLEEVTSLERHFRKSSGATAERLQRLSDGNMAFVREVADL